MALAKPVKVKCDCGKGEKYNTLKQCPDCHKDMVKKWLTDQEKQHSLPPMDKTYV